MISLNHMRRNNQHIKTPGGFTLLEILLVVAAIAILAGIVIVAINPGKQLADTRNAQRRVDVGTILDAVYQYVIDNSGKLPDTVASPIPVGVCSGALAASEICKTAPCAAGVVDISALILAEKYLTAFPKDPNQTVPACNANGVCYRISKSVNGRITVCAPGAEQGAVISVTR
ncbi:MAG: type II secretion system protein [Candidatus Magasanikbacteria bacterium]|nr:type II secretion system protein [Candidatus Magasanikbacteria bacterium]